MTSDNNTGCKLADAINGGCRCKCEGGDCKLADAINDVQKLFHDSGEERDFPTLVAQEAPLEEYRDLLRQRTGKFIEERMLPLLAALDPDHQLRIFATNYWIYPHKKHVIATLARVSDELGQNPMFQLVNEVYTNPDDYSTVTQELQFFNELIYGGNKPSDFVIYDDSLGEHPLGKLAPQAVEVRLPLKDLRCAICCEEVPSQADGIPCYLKKVGDILRVQEVYQCYTPEIVQALQEGFGLRDKIPDLDRRVPLLLNNLLLLLAADPSDSGWDLLHFVTSDTYGTLATGGTVMFLKGSEPPLLGSVMRLLTDQIINYCGLIYGRSELERHARRTAVASIMARNMSHNIGSHVLPSTKLLSRLPIGATEDKIREFKREMQQFHAYLQQRMDFNAQVVTYRVTWGEPLFFFRDLLQGFFQQTILLNLLI